MGLVSSKNPDWKRVFSEGQNFAQGHFCPQSRHLVRLADKIGEVRFSTKIQAENVFFGKTNSWELLRQNWEQFSSRTILPLNAPYSQLGPEKRYGAGFLKKFQPKTCFLEKRIWEGFWGKIEQSFCPEQFCPRTHHIANLERKWGMRPVSSKNSNPKRVF